MKNFQFHIVKSPFFDVKTYEKLTFFIVFLDWHEIMLIHAEGKKRENFKKISILCSEIVIFYVKTYEKIIFFIIFWMNTILHYSSCKYRVYFAGPMLCVTLLISIPTPPAQQHLPDQTLASLSTTHRAPLPAR